MKGMWQSHCHYEFPSPSSIVLSCEPSCYTPSIKLNSSLMSCYFISCFSWTYQQHKFAVKITNLFKCLNRNLNIFLQVDFLLGLLIPLMCTEPWIKVFGYCATTFEPYMLQTWNNLWFSTCLKHSSLEHVLYRCYSEHDLPSNHHCWTDFRHNIGSPFMLLTEIATT